jgi:serine/threonine protein kinase
MKIVKQNQDLSQSVAKNVKTERLLLEKLNHPFLVNMYYAFQEDNKLYIVLELANGGDLFSHILKEKRLYEDHCKFYASEIL